MVHTAKAGAPQFQNHRNLITFLVSKNQCAVTSGSHTTDIVLAVKKNTMFQQIVDGENSPRPRDSKKNTCNYSIKGIHIQRQPTTEVLIGHTDQFYHVEMPS